MAAPNSPLLHPGLPLDGARPGCAGSDLQGGQVGSGLEQSVVKAAEREVLVLAARRRCRGGSRGSRAQRKARSRPGLVGAAYQWRELSPAAAKTSHRLRRRRRQPS